MLHWRRVRVGECNQHHVMGRDLRNVAPVFEREKGATMMIMTMPAQSDKHGTSQSGP
eukprot:CAMPEP_0171270414 /NCGR_PEP_ID=MMETSP0790-20130122/60697_1 /TAXON_ID=2925 /ORGANISM="Alexandrium catenella, Strain OF101" /LENGTH=56 /DNA_ID=CAMNT_0011739251 /DNA_START=1 /DNA_END=167 /DNA_ORIENTATION=-